MQEQMQRAITGALQAGAPGAGSPAAEAGATSSRAGFAAMIQALKSGCTCVSCQLLRKSVEGVIGSVMEDLGVDGSGTDPQPATGQAV
jgi:hypothetical protein